MFSSPNDRRLSLAAGLGLVVLFATEGIAGVPEFPCEQSARDRLQSMSEAGASRDLHWARGFSTLADATPGAAARASVLLAAGHFDAESPSLHARTATALLRSGDARWTQETAAVWRAWSHSFPSQLATVQWVLSRGACIGLWVLIVAGMLRIASTLPGLHHAIRERLAFLPPRLRSPAAFLLLLLPTLPVAALGATAALLWTLLIGTVAAWPSISLRERRAPVAAALLLALSPFALTLWASFVLPGSPGSALHTLWEARTTAGEVSPPRPASAQAPGAEDALRRALVGIRAGNHGDARTALAELRAAVALEPTRWEYRNALGSALLVADDPTGALAQYDRATLLAPREPIPHANRARAWNAQLEFARADAAFRRALERGYRVPETGLDGRTHPDPLPGAATFWEILLRRGAEDFSWAAASRASLSLLVPLRPVWWCVPLFLGALLATRSRRLPRARVCTECGRSVCRKCHFRELRRSLCPECYRLRHRVRTPLARDAALARRRHATLRAERRATLALSVLIPGAGHWTLGRSATALALFAACATVSVSTGSFSLSATALELASLSIVSLILCARATRSRGRSPRGGR